MTWTDLTTSVISMDSKRAHATEIQETASRHAARRAEIEDRAREFDAYDPTIRPTPPAPPASHPRLAHPSLRRFMIMSS